MSLKRNQGMIKAMQQIKEYYGNMRVWKNIHKIFKGGKNIYLCELLDNEISLLYKKKNNGILKQSEKIKGSVYYLNYSEIKTKEISIIDDNTQYQQKQKTVRI